MVCMAERLGLINKTELNLDLGTLGVMYPMSQACVTGVHDGQGSLT